MNPLVSIVIPVYNAEKYVRKCLDSLIEQTHRKLEIICVDDGSTDSSREIIKEYEKRDKRIHLVTQEHSNAGTARNKGLGIAKGEFIAFLDSDDFFETAMIEKMVKKMIFTQADCVICRNVFFDNEWGFYKDMGLNRFQNAQIPDWNNFSKNNIPEHIFQLTACVWDKLYRMSFIRNNKLVFQEQKTNNDVLFVYKTYILAERMAVCDEVAVRYRTNNKESLQGSWENSWQCIFRAVHELETWLRTEGLLEKVNKSFVNYTAWVLTSYMERLTEWAGYLAFFERLKNESIKKLGLFPQEESFYYDLSVYKKIKYISEHSCCEYMLYVLSSYVVLNKERAFRISNLKEKLQQSSEINQIKHWYFQERRLPVGSKVIIYGYGDVGHDLVEQISNSRNLFLQAVVDRDCRKFSGESIVIKSIDEIYTMEFDYILIAIRNKETVEKIRNMLIFGGIGEEKIIGFET